MPAKSSAESAFWEHLTADWKVDSYVFLMERVQRSPNLATDSVFRTVFNKFYGTSRLDEKWRNTYYELFQEARENQEKITLNCIIQALYDRTEGCSPRVSLSFASKMLHTLKPIMPIWDSNNRTFFDMKEVSGNFPSERLLCAKKRYLDFSENFFCFSKTEAARHCIERFNDLMPSYQDISNIKKIDYFTWSFVKCHSKAKAKEKKNKKEEQLS